MTPAAYEMLGQPSALCRQQCKVRVVHRLGFTAADTTTLPWKGQTEASNSQLPNKWSSVLPGEERRERGEGGRGRG